MKRRYNDYKDLVGVIINHVKVNDDYIDFITENNLTIRISKFIPYCVCNVGEYIDEISIEGSCYGTITNVESCINYNYNEEDVYKGRVTFFFDNAKINMKVHGEDNGYYGVCFNMPIEAIDYEVI